MTNKTQTIDDIVSELTDNKPGLSSELKIEREKLATAVVLRDARTELGLTQNELARLANTSQKTIANIENGDNVTFEKYATIAHALGKKVKVSLV